MNHPFMKDPFDLGYDCYLAGNDIDKENPYNPVYDDESYEDFRAGYYAALADSI